MFKVGDKVRWYDPNYFLEGFITDINSSHFRHNISVKWNDSAYHPNIIYGYDETQLKSAVSPAEIFNELLNEK